MVIFSFSTPDPKEHFKKELVKMKAEGEVKTKISSLTKSVREKAKKEAGSTAQWEDVTPDKIEEIPQPKNEEQWDDIGEKVSTIPQAGTDEQYEDIGDNMDTTIGKTANKGASGDIIYDKELTPGNKEYFKEEENNIPKPGIRKSAKKSYSLVIKSSDKNLIDVIEKAVKAKLGQDYTEKSAKASVEVEAPVEDSLKLMKSKYQAAKKFLKSDKEKEAFKRYLIGKHVTKKPTQTALNMIKGEKSMTTGDGGAGVVGVGMGTKNQSWSFKNKKKKKKESK